MAETRSGVVPASLTNPAGLGSYRLELVIADRDGVTQRISSEVVGRTSWHRVIGSDNQTEEVITTPGGVWVGGGGVWREVQLDDIDAMWAIALGTWQLAAPEVVFPQIDQALPNMAFASHTEMDGQTAMKMVGGPEAIATFFGEDDGDVLDGAIEVVVTAGGVPLHLHIETTEVLDQSIPLQYSWTLTDLGTLSALDLPEGVEAGTGLPIPLIGIVNGGGCGAEPDGCPDEILIYGDGIWQIGADTIQNSGMIQLGEFDPELLDPVVAALADIDVLAALAKHSRGECPQLHEVPARTVLFPQLPSWEQVAACTVPHDRSVSPYREVFELLIELGLD